MKGSWNVKIVGVFIALLLTINGCSSNSVPTTSPVKTEESQQVKTQVQPDTPVIKDAAPTPEATTPTPVPVIVEAPATTPVVTPAPTPTTQKVVAPAPAPAPVAPPIVTPAPAQKQTPQAVTVYITKTGAKYHRDGCRYLSKSKIPISLSDAKSGYGPCSVCNPPQ
ncbi:hypothetical protein [Desulfosporosinus fructosivorans]|uniref:hypothetical protein n=1 Tax=Desulfosporosinus fructosivorans TaxID=2018669 RepID=UPI001FB14097|nr:hypothetical protein [Desulfosporosinus fructosivorans]